MPPIKSLRYEREVAADVFSEDQILLSLIQPGESVLELGCHSGYLSQALDARGSYVLGLDNDRHAVAIAQRRGVDARVTDLQQPGSLNELGEFDIVLAANVLEHLTRPSIIVAEAREVLSPSGRLLVSVPNIAHFKVRMALLRGRFEYTDAGILDSTHTRFFTRRTLRSLLEEHGWRIRREFASPGGVEGVLRRALMPHLARRVPGLFAIHLIAEAIPQSSL